MLGNVDFQRGMLGIFFCKGVMGQIYLGGSE